MPALPAPFIQQMKQLLGTQADAFLQSYEQPRTYGLRLNTLKIEAEHPVTAKMIRLFDLQPLSWCNEGFTYAAAARPGRHLYHAAGLYYIQEPSAMIAAELLDPQPGEIVLDLAAAPGGKTTQLAAIMQGQGVLVANEIHPARARILSENVERFGIANVIITQTSPQQLADRFPAQFDRILLDAPCSGEGMFRKNPEAIDQWSLAAVEACAVRQRDILASAAQLLKPGGALVYSTCTFNTLENEETIADFTAAHPDFRLVKEERMWPHLEQGEGHYAALLVKDCAASRQSPPSRSNASVRKNRSASTRTSVQAQRHAEAALSSVYAAFSCQHIPGFQLPKPGQWLSFGEEIYWLPAPASSPITAESLHGLRVLRPGLHVGQLRAGKRIEPRHALAMAAPASAAALLANWPAESPEVAAYCRGETIAAPADTRGWGLAAIDGFPLGWVKASDGQYKNHRPKALRL